MTAKEYLKKNWNVPNVLTLIRLLLVPVYIVLFVKGMKYPALIVFVSACLTDLFDGMIARKYHLITNFGKLMDPFADKVMVLTAMFSMMIGNEAIPAVIPLSAVIVLLLKELVMVAGGLLLLKKGLVVYSSMIGKVAHCIFIGGLVLCFFHDWFLQLCPGWFLTPDLIVIWLAVITTLCALVFYVTDSIRKAKEQGLIGQ
ncbi:MAG: CDP-alcohol phosphatidyltransferase family protein [Eubacteriales bacterium]|nr:CDP-alcohol phosphatidyltransferase family protein [Eubacteriales bacterium]